MSNAKVRVTAAAAPAYLPGDSRPLEIDTAGNLFVNIATGTLSVTGGNPAASATGSAVPTSGDYLAFSNASGSLTGVSPTTPLPVVQKTAAPGAGTTNVVTTSGTAVAAATGPWQGGIVKNPYSGTGTLFINLVSAAGTLEAGATFALLPGDSRNLPPVSSGVTLSANASSNSYTFCLEIDV